MSIAIASVTVILSIGNLNVVHATSVDLSDMGCLVDCYTSFCPMDFGDASSSVSPSIGDFNNDGNTASPQLTAANEIDNTQSQSASCPI